MNNKVKLGIAGAAVLLGAWLLWSTIFSGEDAPDTSNVAEPAGEQASVGLPAEEGVSAEEGRAILALLNDLKNIRLDESFFADTIFVSLIDWSVSLEPEPKGRPNPFAPIGVDVSP